MGKDRNMVMQSVWIPVVFKEKLRKLHKLSGLTQSEIIRRAIMREITELEKLFHEKEV